MYCPRCATQNLDGAKFCRACGTNLETVALALAQQLDPTHPSGDKDAAKKPKPSKNKLEKRSEGVTKIVRASGLIGASALVGAAWLSTVARGNRSLSSGLTRGALSR